MTCAHCGARCVRIRPHQRHCGEACRRQAFRKRVREARAKERAKRADVPRAKSVRRPRLECKWCGMGHRTDQCQRNRVVVKQYGTVVDGRYVPPPGVKVRHIQIPATIHGDRLRVILKELGR